MNPQPISNRHASAGGKAVYKETGMWVFNLVLNQHRLVGRNHAPVALASCVPEQLQASPPQGIATG